MQKPGKPWKNRVCGQKGGLQSHQHGLWIRLWTMWISPTKTKESLWIMWITLWITGDNPVDYGDKLWKRCGKW